MQWKTFHPLIFIQIEDLSEKEDPSKTDDKTTDDSKLSEDAKAADDGNKPQVIQLLQFSS